MNVKNMLEQRFPQSASVGGSGGETTNSAIMLYGRRFYKDQTPVEYLAEFLLVFLSPKGSDRANEKSFIFNENSEPYYWPKDRLALKLFSFFPSSKLETRHSVHQKTYLEALELLRKKIEGSSEEKDETIRILQSLFSGFTGVAKNRTWVTYSFLPAAESFVSRELAWRHSQAQNDAYLSDWNSSKKYFSHDGHLFLARGGEVLFLQLAHLFSEHATSSDLIAAVKEKKDYEHLTDLNVAELQESLESGLSALFTGSIQKIDHLSAFVEETLSDINTFDEPKYSKLGWVPRASAPEAFLFACELNNICSSAMSGLDKLELLQTLCCLHVLRSLCFQAHRVDEVQKPTSGFVGNYTWIVANPDAAPGDADRKLSQASFDRTESTLYRVLRIVSEIHNEGGEATDLKQADEHGFKIFRKIAKEIGLVIPKTGQGQRFVMTPLIMRVLVAATVRPAERVRLTTFYERVFAHFGIALAGQQLSQAITWLSEEDEVMDYSINKDSLWIEEGLKQGGFLVELSDAVSMVHNPGSKE